MPVHEFDLASLLLNLDDTFLAEALLFPEVSRFGEDLQTLRNPSYVVIKFDPR